MAVVGILILVGMKLAVDYMKREIRRYEDEYDNEEESLDSSPRMRFPSNHDGWESKAYPKMPI